MKKSILIILILSLYIFISYSNVFNTIYSKNYPTTSNSYSHLYDAANLSAKIDNHLQKAFKDISKNEQRDLRNPIHQSCRKSVRKPVDKKIDPTILKLTIKPLKSMCPQKHADLFIYVFNRAASNSIRTTIRNTWANKNRKLFKNLKLAFIVGQAENDYTNKVISQEAKQYHDIIQTNIPDTLKNLPYKSVAAWKWITEYCTNVKYVLKLDDDTVVNTYLLLDFIKYLITNHAGLSNKYFCEILNEGKYSITCDEFDRTMYDPYCCGIANIITGDLIVKMYNATFNSKYFWVDDAYVGFITQSLDVNMHDISKSIISNRQKYNKRNQNYLFARDTSTPAEILKTWDLIEQTHYRMFSANRQDTSYWKNII